MNYRDIVAIDIEMSPSVSISDSLMKAKNGIDYVSKMIESGYEFKEVYSEKRDGGPGVVELVKHIDYRRRRLCHEKEAKQARFPFMGEDNAAGGDALAGKVPNKEAQQGKEDGAWDVR